MITSDITIAPAVPSDTAEIVRMLAALAEHERDPVANFDAAAAERDLFSDSPWLSGHVARIGTTTVGVVLWHAAYETSFAARGAYVISLWVDPQFRRRGTATALIAAVADAARAEGSTFVWWASKPWNRNAHATYASLNARQEPVMAHALVGDDFQDLANRHRKGAATS